MSERSERREIRRNQRQRLRERRKEKILPQSSKGLSFIVRDSFYDDASSVGVDLSYSEAYKPPISDPKV